MLNICESVFGERIKKLDSLSSWLKSEGIDVCKTRIGEYQRFISYLSGKTSGRDFSEDDSARMVHTLREIEELLWIQEGLKTQKLKGGIDVLRKILGGAPYAKDDSISASARDFQLELRIASYFLQTGFAVDMEGDCDLVVPFSDGKLFVECKRMKSRNKVMKRAKSAALQLKKRYRDTRQLKYGLAVFDVSNILMPNQGITSGPTEVGVRDLIRHHLVAFSRQFEVAKYFMTDKNVLSVWLQAIVPAWYPAQEEQTTEIATRISSFHLVLAPEYGPKAKAFSTLRRVLEFGLP